MAKSILSNNPGQLVTKAKVNISDWTSYTPTFQGFGTVTNINVRWRRVGDNLEVEGYFSTGTGTGVEARMGFPSGLVSASTLPTLSLAGKVIWNDATNPASYFHGLIEPNVSYFTFGGKQTTQSQLLKVDGNSYTTSPHNLSIKFSVPIQGWDSQAEFLAPQIQPKIAYCRMQSTDTRVAIGANTTVTLSAIDGDTEILSLSSNQFTLQPGKYLIDWSFYMLTEGTGAVIVSTNLFNVTDSVVVRHSTATGGASVGRYTPVFGSTVLTIQEAKTFRIRANNDFNTGSHAAYVGENSVGNSEKGFVKITKIS